MKGSDFLFDSFNFLYCKCHRINPNRGRSYIDFPDSIKNKKTLKNIINDDDDSFQHDATVALNHQKIGKSSQIISKIKQ